MGKRPMEEVEELDRAEVEAERQQEENAVPKSEHDTMEWQASAVLDTALDNFQQDTSLLQGGMATITLHKAK